MYLRTDNDYNLATVNDYVAHKLLALRIALSFVTQ